MILELIEKSVIPIQVKIAEVWSVRNIFKTSLRIFKELLQFTRETVATIFVFFTSRSVTLPCARVMT